MRTAAAVIPSRFGAQRFPGKPLALISGVPLVLRVLRQVKKARCFSDVIVATDDERIATAVWQDGGVAVLTDPALPSGTDRVWAAARGIQADVILNVQGDEPLISPAFLEDLAQYLLASPEVPMATGCFPLDPARAPDPNTVKVVLDSKGFALYFSRCAIPYRRQPETGLPFLKHLGIYGYQRSALQAFTALPVDPLERAEGLEQLRALSAGMKIAVLRSAEDSVGVDSPEDVARVEALVDASEA